MEDIKILVYKDENIPEDYFHYLNSYYLPIIGGKSVFLYLFFKERIKTVIDESYIFTTLGYSKTDYQYSRKMLEAVGLIESYVKNKEMIIFLKPVLSPSVFFNSVHLRKLLLSCLGNDEEELKKIEEQYIPEYNLDGFKEKSAKLLDVFEIKLNSGNSTSILPKEKKSEKGFNFSFASFLKYLKKYSQINIKSLNEEEEKKIEDLAQIYSLKEEELAKYVSIFYDPLNTSSRINFKKMEEELINSSMFNHIPNKSINEEHIKSNDELINYYQSMTPLEFLRSTLNGKEPSTTEKNIIKVLSNDYNLNGEMINCLLDYTLKKDDNHLYKNNVLTYLSPLIRKNVDNIYDMLDALYNLNEFESLKKKKKTNKKEKEADSIKDSEESKTIKIKLDEKKTSENNLFSLEDDDLSI